jgi:hypothetical protein
MPPADPNLLQLIAGIGLCIGLIGAVAAFIDWVIDDDALPPF